MNIEVIASPRLLTEQHLVNRTVVVLDVLRATTTMIAALHAGCRAIRIFREVDEAQTAARACSDPHLLCGERRAQPPPGFDLGNSPGDFTPARCAGRTLFMTTTNGTMAILAAGAAPQVLVGAVANARAVARQLRANARDVTLLCAGQREDVAMEDLIGCGAVLDALQPGGAVEHVNDSCHIALGLFANHRHDLGAVFRRCRGARTELRLGLERDIDFCAMIDRYDLVGQWNPERREIEAIR